MSYCAGFVSKMSSVLLTYCPGNTVVW